MSDATGKALTKTCPDCKGTGKSHDFQFHCIRCSGKGQVIYPPITTPTPSTQTEGDGIDEILKRLESGSNVSAVDEDRDKMRLCAALRRLRESAEPVGDVELKEALLRLSLVTEQDAEDFGALIHEDSMVVCRALDASRSLLVQREKELAAALNRSLSLYNHLHGLILDLDMMEHNGVTLNIPNGGKYSITEAAPAWIVSLHDARAALTPNPETRV